MRRELRQTVEQVVAKTQVRQTIVTSIGELLGFKGIIVDYVVRHLKKLVPKFSLPGSIRLSDALAEGRKRPLERVEVGHDDIAFLQYTGGTTGVAKGAMLLNRNIIANMVQARAWIRPFLDDNRREIIITPLPLYHIFSLTANCLVFMSLGGENVLIPNPRDIPGFVKEMAKYKFTGDHGRQHAVQRARQQPRVRQARLLVAEDHAGRRDGGAGSGGGEVEGGDRRSAHRGVRAHRDVPRRDDQPAGHPRVQRVDRGADLVDRGGACATMPGKDVPLGQPGEICIRGPQVMAGYWQHQAETDKVIDKNGWFATGDIGVMDEKGFVRIVDRKKDMILVSGFNVYPNEIEGVVAAHPGVLECAAVGVPDKKSGEAVKLYVVKKDAALTSDDVLKYCREHLTNYKVPREVEFRAELPKSNVGKILRRELRDEGKKTAA